MRLRCVSWNTLHLLDLRSGRVDVGAAATALAALSCDLVGLQELDRGQARSGGVDQLRALAAELQLDGVFGLSLAGHPDTSWHALDGDDPGGAAYGVGLLSRWPIRDATVHRLPGGGDGRRRPGATPSRPGWDREPRVALTATVDVAGTSVRVTTVHLSYLPWRGAAQMAVAARAAGRTPGPAVLMGDFNLPAPIVRGALRGWQHAGGSASYPAAGPRLQLDHVLVRGGVRVLSVSTGPALIGDHLPIVADLELP